MRLSLVVRQCDRDVFNGESPYSIAHSYLCLLRKAFDSAGECQKKRANGKQRLECTSNRAAGRSTASFDAGSLIPVEGLASLLIVFLVRLDATLFYCAPHLTNNKDHKKGHPSLLVGGKALIERPPRIGEALEIG
jgi:hypothetical protein